jgi:short-subunit dehydrogenase
VTEHVSAGQPPQLSAGSGRLALITGASSGIGQAFAQRLGAAGYDLIVVGRRRERLEELVAALPEVQVRVLVADLGTDAGVEEVADVCASEALSMLINNAGVAHYMPFAALTPEKANEVVHVKVVAPTLLCRAAVPGMVSRGEGTIINVAGMLAFGGPAPAQGRAVYTGTLAHLVALSQQLHQELSLRGVQVQALCPGVVATEFHERQGIDLSAIPRMSAEDVVTASLQGLALGEVICAPGVERSELLEAVFGAELAAFHAQAPQLAERYRTS